MEQIIITDQDTGKTYELACPYSVVEILDDLYGRLEDGRYVMESFEIGFLQLLLTERLLCE